MSDIAQKAEEAAERWEPFTQNHCPDHIRWSRKCYRDGYAAALAQRHEPAEGEWSHGINCPKAPHGNRTGHLHAEDDDAPYSVDGIRYCGRCHRCIPRTAIAGEKGEG